MTAERQSAAKPARRAWIGAGLLALCLSGAGLAAVFLLGRPIEAPDWLRERIETRIDESLPGLSLRFGRVSVVLERDGQARVILWDVSVLNAEGGVIASLSDVEAGFAPGPLLRGRLELREAQLSGAFVTLTRGVDGRIGLALGDAFAAEAERPDLPALIDLVDRAFADPRLARLRAIEADALTIRFEDRRARRGWTADGGRLRVARDGDRLGITGDVALLGGGDDVATLALTGASVIGQTTLDFGLRLSDLAARDIATQSPALAFFSALDAPISGALRARLRADGSLGTLNATLQIGAGELKPNAATEAIRFDSARTYLTYVPDRDLLRFDEIAVSAPLGAVTATGSAQLEGAEEGGWPRAFVGQVALSDIRLDETALLDRAVTLSGADLQFRLGLRPFGIELGAFTVTDPALPVRGRGAMNARPGGWQVALDAALNRATPEEVLSYWPEDLRPGTRDWVRRHVRAGSIEDATFALRSEPGSGLMLYLDFAFRDAEVLYNLRLPAVEAAAGRVTIYDNRLALRLDAGRIVPETGGALDLSGTEFVMPDLRVTPNPGVVDLRAKGALTAALSYLDNDAWRVMRRLGRPVDLAQATARAEGRIAMPLRAGLTLGDVEIDLDGTLTDLESATLVPDRPLAAQRLAVSVSNSSLAIEGPVTLAGIAADARWEQPFGDPDGGAVREGRVTAEFDLGPDTITALGLALPPSMLSGRGRAALVLDLPRAEAPRFALRSDLVGLGLSLPQIGWQLSEAAGGALAIDGALDQPPRIDRLSLSGPGLEAEGGLRLRPGGGIETLRLDRLRVGDWLDTSAELSGRGPGVAPAVSVAGGTLDLRRAPFGRGGAGADDGGAPISVRLDRLRVTETIAVDDFSGAFDTRGGLRGRVTGRIGGEAPISAEISPDEGRMAIRIRGEDAGDILEAAGLFENVQNGTFALDLTAVPGAPGVFDGALTIIGARLRNAPAIAGLLDAVSVVGLIDQLNGPGIFFQEIEARFRLTPRQIILAESSAVGPSMGISMDGFYDLAARRMDMQGVLSPVYVLNAIGRLIAPRKGEGLIGFTFTLGGPVAAPRVSVNPLSAFTPGMFRDIFRKPPPEIVEQDP